jgi:hypothetical protein
VLAAAVGIATVIAELASTWLGVKPLLLSDALRAAFLLMALSQAVGLPFAAALA